VDESGKPIEGLEVAEEWMYFDLDIAPKVDRGVTDKWGHVSLSRKITWASLATRLLCFEGPGTKDTGPSAFILACDDNHLLEARLFWDGNKFWNRSAPETGSRLVARPVEYCTMM